MNQSLVKKWLVTQIKPNSYNLAIQNLERQGFKTFLPKIKTIIKKVKKNIYKDTFLFPGYLFVSVDLQNSNWTKINSTYGVSKVLTFNNRPSEISHDLIELLKNRYEENVYQSSKENLQKGNLIKFKSGPLFDLVAKIESVSENDRIYVLLEWMGGYRKLKLDLKEKISFYKV